MFDPKIIGTH